MQTLSRREMLIAAGAAACAAALPGRLSATPSPEPTLARAPNSALYRFRVGEIEAATLLSGAMESPATLPPRAGEREFREALEAEFNRFRDDPKAKKVQAAWTPRVYQILPAAFSETDGTMNSTMKLVRGRIARVHAELIDYSYGAEGSETKNPRNLQVLRTMFKLP